MNRIFAIFIVVFAFEGCRHAQPAIYFIPKNYEGVFAVVYDEMNGIEKLEDPIGETAFIIPENGILITKAKFSDGLREDSFLQNTGDGYKTLKSYLPNMDTTGRKFDKGYYEMYSKDPNKPLINFRQIRDVTFNKFDSAGEKTGSCTFHYELITVGRASHLSDSLAKIFIVKLDSYLKKEFCK